MSITSNLLTYVTRVATEFKAIRTLISGSGTGNTSALNTAATDIVGAVNEVLVVANTAPAGTATETYVDNAVAALADTAPAALDTLNELAAALGDDPNFAATITTALGTKANAADVYTKAEIGDDAADYVAAFEAALL